MKTKALVVALSLLITAAGSVANACANQNPSNRGENLKTAALIQPTNQQNPKPVANPPVNPMQTGADYVVN